MHSEHTDQQVGIEGKLVEVDPHAEKVCMFGHIHNKYLKTCPYCEEGR